MSFFVSMPEMPEAWLPRLKAIGEHYSSLAVRTGDAIDLEAARAALAVLYTMARLRPPRNVVVSRGPGEAARLVDGGSPEVQDRVKGTLLTALRPWGPELEHRYLCSRRMDLDEANVRRLRQVAWPGKPSMPPAGLGRVKWPFTAMAELMAEMGHLHHPALSAWRRFVLAGAWDCLLLEDTAVLCPPPTLVSLDDQGRLHDDRGPCVRWDDGTRACRIHGVPVAAHLLEDPTTIRAEDVMRERNVEVRRVLMSLMGLDRFLAEAGAKIRHEDFDGARMPRRLLYVNVPWEREVNAYVEVTCPSTGHRHYLRVPPDVNTCADAVAWTFGLEPARYRPLIEA